MPAERRGAQQLSISRDARAPDAMRHLQAGHAVRKLVLTVTDAG
jgi:hypothetical protein